MDNKKCLCDLDHEWEYVTTIKYENRDHAGNYWYAEKAIFKCVRCFDLKIIKSN